MTDDMVDGPGRHRLRPAGAPEPAPLGHGLGGERAPTRLLRGAVRLQVASPPVALSSLAGNRPSEPEPHK